jgi:hypothetical protein
MEPRREEQNKSPPPSAKKYPNRFRIVRLDARYARGGGRVQRAPLLECMPH